MRRVVTALTVVVAVAAFGSLALAQTPAAKTAAKAHTAVVKTVKTAKTMSAIGTVASFDEATRMLMLKTRAGEKAFTLTPDAKLMAGAKAAMTADLVGKHAKVTYTEVEGKNVASHVAVAVARKTEAKKAETKEPAAKK